MFNLMRDYAITSFVSLIVAAVLLTALYRHLEIQQSVELAQKSEVTRAENIAYSIGPELGDYLQSVSKVGPQQAARAPMPPALAAAIARRVNEAAVVGIKIYNDQGVVVFSTDPAQIGAIEAGETDFISAVGGKAKSYLLDEDPFSNFARRAPGDWLAYTSVPVRGDRTGPIRGVLSIQTDLSRLVAQDEHDIRALVAGIAAILLLLYCVLFLTVLRAQKIIDAQQAIMRDRTQTLEALSAEMLKNEEIEKTELAVALQEDLAQTLSAIKMRIQGSAAASRAEADVAALPASIVAALQGVVEELRHAAVALRPSSLDELGLLPTIHWYCRELERSHPSLRINPSISVAESDIPESLKTAMYRIIERALKDIAANSSASRIELNLGQTATAITLAIDADPGSPGKDAAVPTSIAANPSLQFLIAQERAALSGGAFSLATNASRGVTLRMRWNIVQASPDDRRGEAGADLEHRSAPSVNRGPSPAIVRIHGEAA